MTILPADLFRLIALSTTRSWTIKQIQDVVMLGGISRQALRDVGFSLRSVLFRGTWSTIDRDGSDHGCTSSLESRHGGGCSHLMPPSHSRARLSNSSPTQPHHTPTPKTHSGSLRHEDRRRLTVIEFPVLVSGVLRKREYCWVCSGSPYCCTFALTRCSLEGATHRPTQPVALSACTGFRLTLLAKVSSNLLVVCHMCSSQRENFRVIIRVQSRHQVP